MPDDVFTAPLFDDSYLRFLMAWQQAASESFLQAQRIQWELFTSWQQSLDAMQRELQDQWICRFGGGVPLDG